jgi:glucose-6-phosphate 1-dehydrogenase
MPSVLIVIFGASGDLAKRKLLPALFHLWSEESLPESLRILGYARSEYSDAAYHKEALKGLTEHAGEVHNGDLDEESFRRFVEQIEYQSGDYDDPAAFQALADRIAKIDEAHNQAGNHLFYLATPPNVFMSITENLAAAGLATSEGGGWTRLIIEKPFGHDLESAHTLNQHLHKNFAEDQVFRIDHYLGKETVQNIFVLRFGNGIFEPIWNRNYVDHVQITVAETLGIGERGGYYDRSGALRDMVQNHMMQVMALTAMEPPVGMDAKSIRDQKVNLLRSVQRIAPEDVERFAVRGQYAGGRVNGEEIASYLETPEVDPDSTTETYVAWRVGIDNWRWQGVPFYLRTGKALASKLTEVNIVFRKPPLMLVDDSNNPLQMPNNVLSLRIQPDEGITLTFDAKKPGNLVEAERVQMDFSYLKAFGAQRGEAYERLILDALLGDSTLFIRHDEVEVAWDRVTALLDGWKMQEEAAAKRGAPLRLPQYRPGSWGPTAADELLKRDGRYWRNNGIQS